MCSQNAAKMMSPAARLHCYDARRQFRCKLDNSLTAHASPQHNGSADIQANDAAAVLAQINPQNRDLHDLFPPNRLSTDTMSPALRRGAPFHKCCKQPNGSEQMWRERAAAGYESKVCLILPGWCLSTRPPSAPTW